MIKMGMPLFDTLAGNLVTYLFGDIKILGVFIIMFFLLLLFMMRLPKIVMGAFMLPILVVMAVQSQYIPPWVALTAALVVAILFGLIWAKFAAAN